VTRIRPAAWLMAAVALFLLAVAGYALLVHAFPQYYWTQIDTGVYRDGGIAVRNQPAMLYALDLGAAKLPFTYTPFAALLFAAGSGASFATWQVGLTVLTIGLLPVVAYLSLGLAGRPAGLARAAAAFAIAAVGLWLEPVAMTLFFGQINLLLLALVVGDLALPDRIKGKGIGIGLAAGIKLTPLIFIPYLLFTRRVRAAAVSALTFAVTAGLGFALLPHASAVYWGGQITRPGSKPFHLDNQSLNGVILRLTHAGPDAHAYWLVAAVVVGIAGLATSILASRRGHELLGLVACAATGLLVSPVTWSHHYVYVVPALVLAAYGPRPQTLPSFFSFQGFSAGGRVEVVKQVWLSTNLGQSTGTGDTKTALNQMYGITFGRLPWVKLRADAHYSRFSGSFGNGSYEAVSLSRQLSERLRLEALAGQQNFASTITANTRSRFLTGTVETTLGPHYYLQGIFTTNRGDISYDQMMFSIGYRFDSKRRGE